jgi:chromosome segregation ATPase
MEQDDLIRRLKVLSKSQSAFLKAYCHSKLNGGVELIKEALKLLKASGFRDKDKKINDIYEKIEQLKLEEIEVNLDSAELLMKSEIALLRASVENNQEPTSSTNLINDAQQVTTLNSKITSLEADNKKLRDLLEKAKSELVAYSKASSAVPPPPSPVATATNQLSSSSNEEDILKIASLEAVLQDIQAKAAEKDAQFKRLELICLGYEEEIENHKSLKQSTISAEAGRFKAELDSLQTKFENTVKEYENKLNEEKGKSEKSLSTLEARLETEKEEMMEAMAQEIEEIEKTNQDKITSFEQKINELSGQLSKSQSNRSNIINGLTQIKSKFATIKQSRKSVSEESRKLLQSFGNSFTAELGDKLKYKLKVLIYLF